MTDLRPPPFRPSDDKGAPEDVLYFHVGGGGGNGPAHVRLEQHWWPAYAWTRTTLGLGSAKEVLEVAGKRHPRLNRAEAVRLLIVETLLAERTDLEQKLCDSIERMVAATLNSFRTDTSLKGSKS